MVLVSPSDEIQEDFDAVVLATGYHSIAGHQKILDKSICSTLGAGFDSVRNGNIVSGEESSYPNLWFIWGTLQKITTVAPTMAAAIKHRIACINA